MLRKVKVVSKNPIKIYEDYAEIVLLDRRCNSKSGVKGVYKCKTTGKRATEIKVNQKKIWLGRFDALDEAREVRAKAEEKYFKDFRYKPIEVD